ncbi:hypothetical protein FDUTEX481_02172 [Tolypothrix sp. PCC 7601]|nr:hypothetical protein FDUTEX481_02172 [Tolypothrix sp. PCC 7601]
MLIERYKLLYLWRFAAYAGVIRRRDSSRLYKGGDRLNIYT